MRRAALLAGVVFLTAPAIVFAQGEDVVPAGQIIRRPFGPAARSSPPPVVGAPIYPGVPAPVDQPPGVPGAEQPPPPRELPTDRLATPFATQTGGGGLQGRAFNEEFDGDMGGIFYRRTTIVGLTSQQVQIGTRTQVVINPRTGQRTVITVPVFGVVQVPLRRTVQVPIAGRYSGIQITDNDSPRPVDRIYGGYNYYDKFGASLNPSPGFGNVSQNGNASIGLRLPFIQLNAPNNFGGDVVGDLSVLVKYALINDRDTGNVLSVGMVLSTPTGGGGNVLLADGSTAPHSVLFQPWVGFVKNFDRGYVQGISNIIVPTDRRDPTLLGNSLAIGYWLYRGNPERWLPGVTPTAEVHVRTPLNHRDPLGLVYLPDQVNLTGGLHFRWPRFTISGAVGVPVVGPRPWNVETLVNLNYRF
jgi:hypothetical protein